MVRIPRQGNRRKRRMPCTFSVGESQHNALLLDLSCSGLFIQTTARTEPGQQFEVALSDRSGTDLRLKVEVVRRKVVPPRLVTVAQGGVGVRILEAPDEYRALLRELGIPDDAPKPAAKLFGVLLRQTPGFRSKRLQIEAPDEASAEQAVREEMGDDWKVQQVYELD